MEERLVSDVVDCVERRAVTPDGVRRTVRYVLCRDLTATGAAFYYVKCHMSVWRGGVLLQESHEVAGGLGTDQVGARRVFDKLAHAVAMVFPEHVADIVRDELLSQPATGRRGEGALHCSGSALA
ncbi:MAG: hypothetical protein IRY95_09090 [Clostridia bacterium]|nr:hypothetical protein [Clostridia bacterium]